MAVSSHVDIAVTVSVWFCITTISIILALGVGALDLELQRLRERAAVGELSSVEGETKHANSQHWRQPGESTTLRSVDLLLAPCATVLVPALEDERL